MIKCLLKRDILGILSPRSKGAKFQNIFAPYAPLRRTLTRLPTLHLFDHLTQHWRDLFDAKYEVPSTTSRTPTSRAIRSSKGTTCDAWDTLAISAAIACKSSSHSSSHPKVFPWLMKCYQETPQTRPRSKTSSPRSKTSMAFSLIDIGPPVYFLQRSAVSGRRIVLFGAIAEHVQRM